MESACLSLSHFIVIFLTYCFILRYFNSVFGRPYWCFSVTLKVILSLSDRYKIFTSDWPRIKVCQNAVLSEINITMTRINKKSIKSEFCAIYTCYWKSDTRNLMSLVILRLYFMCAECNAVEREQYNFPSSKIQRFRNVGDNDRRSKRFCSNAVLCANFTWQMVKTRAIRLWVIEGPNVRNEHSIHSKWKFKQMQATYMRPMRNNNL